MSGQAILESLISFLGLCIPVGWLVIVGLQHIGIYLVGIKVSQAYAREVTYSTCELPQSFQDRHQNRASRWISAIPGVQKITLAHDQSQDTCTITIRMIYKIPFLHLRKTVTLEREHSVLAPIHIEVIRLLGD